MISHEERECPSNTLLIGKPELLMRYRLKLKGEKGLATQVAAKMVHQEMMKEIVKMEENVVCNNLLATNADCVSEIISGRNLFHHRLKIFKIML